MADTTETTNHNEDSIEALVITAKDKRYITVKVLTVVREAQLAHGLRHNDYQLYRQYCSRRIRRLRKYTDLVQGDRKNFRKKHVTVELLKNDRYLLIPLMTLERLWAFAMQLKGESKEDPRKKFSFRNKLRKAAQHIELFEKLVEESSICDARTQLEVQGYCAWLKGTVLFELADWNHEWIKPVEFFNKALTIYKRLRDAASDEDAEVYESRLQELEVKLRFCRHHLGDRTATDTLLAMRGNEALGDKLDNLLAEAREQQAATLSEVVWRGRTLTVKHEKIRLFLVNEGLIHDELEKTSNANERVEMLDKLLMECKDALQLVRDELNTDPTFKPRQQASEGPVSPLHFLHTYLSYHRLNLTIIRNDALVETYQKIVLGEEKVEDGKKAPKLQDLIRLQEIILQNLNEIANLAGLEEDTQLKGSLEGQVKSYKAHRCYFIAETYVKMEKWGEALVLYEKALSYIKVAKKSQIEASMAKRLDNLTGLVNSKHFHAHARAVLASETPTLEVSKMTLKDKKMLIDRLDEYVEDPRLTTKNPSICQVPTPLASVPCKPLFYDLALNHIDYPNLDDKVETKKEPPAAAAGGGLTGLVKGLWGWGSKK